MRRSRTLVMVALALVLALGVAACDMLGIGFTPLAGIAASPARFDGQDVKVSGVVTSVTKIPFVEVKAYIIRADGAELTVTTLGALPAINQKVSVQGKIESAAIVGGRSVGLRMIERRRF